MADKRLDCLESLIQSYMSSQHDLSGKASQFILKMMKKELEYDSGMEHFDWVYLKLCGNNFRETEYRLVDQDITSLCASLINIPIINSLDLRYNNISNDGAISLAHYLKRSQCLKELNIKGNFISELGAREIGEALKCNRTLEKLDISVNPISRGGGIAIAQGLRLNNTLTHLDVGDCGLEISASIAFSTVLRTNKTIVYFNLDRLILFSYQEEQTVQLCEMLGTNTTLKEFHLSRCGIRDYGAECLVDSLDKNKILQVLDLSSNRVGLDGGTAIARGLGNRCSLTILDLSHNRIQCGGAVAIADALKSANKRLVVLCLNFNAIGERGLCALAESLYSNESLRFIYLWGNNITEKAAEMWANLITIGRLREDSTDLKPFKADGRVQMAYQDPIKEKGYRYATLSWSGQVPERRSLALF